MTLLTDSLLAYKNSSREEWQKRFTSKNDSLELWNPRIFLNDLNNEMKKVSGSYLYDPEDEDTSFRDSALIIFTILTIGSIDRKRLKLYTQLSPYRISEVLRNLRGSGILVGSIKRGIYLSDWDDKELGWMNFILDCMVGAGSIMRTSENGVEK